MNIKIIKQEKGLVELEIDNLTIAELLRAYLNKEGADVAVWKRTHPSKPALLHVESDNPIKLIQKSISVIEKELDKLQEEFKKSK